MKEKEGRLYKLLLGVFAMLVYSMLYTFHGTFNYIVNRLTVTLASTFFIKPIIYATVGEIKMHDLISNIFYGAGFLVIYIAFAKLTTFDMIRIFLEQFITVCFVLWVVSFIREKLVKS